MKIQGKPDLRSLLPLLTVIGTFAAVGIILFSIMEKREPNAGGDRTDAVPGENTTVAAPAGTEKGPETETKTETETAAPQTTEATAPQTEPEPEPEPPKQTIPVGIYTESSNNCKRVDEFNGYFPSSDDDPHWVVDTWTYSDHSNLICDLTQFVIFTSTEEEINVTSWDETWVDRWKGCGLDDTYKIGFEFLIVTKDGESRRFTVLSPSDTFKEEEFFELYMYDSVAHAHDSWYYHITEETNYPNTKNIIIKITLRNGCYDIDHIKMTAFVYNSADEFDADGFYTGPNRASVMIGRE